jgi:hypothetical protein
MGDFIAGMTRMVGCPNPVMGAALIWWLLSGATPGSGLTCLECGCKIEPGLEKHGSLYCHDHRKVWK